MEQEKRGKLFGLVLFTGLLILAVGGAWLIIQSDVLHKRFNTGQISQPGYYKIDHFVDGDTIAVNMNGNIETVRMIGVDTPETHKPNTPVQCFGPEAATFTKNLIGNSSVRLQADPLGTNRDRYGRLLRYVYLPDGRMVEEQLLSGGYAFAYTQFPFQKAEAFTRLEKTASAAKKGLWSACQVTVESNGRGQTNNQ